MHDPKYEVGYENGYAAGYIDATIRANNMLNKFLNNELVEKTQSEEPLTIARAIERINGLKWEYEKALAERSEE